MAGWFLPSFATGLLARRFAGKPLTRVSRFAFDEPFNYRTASRGSASERNDPHRTVSAHRQGAYKTRQPDLHVLHVHVSISRKFGVIFICFLSAPWCRDRKQLSTCCFQMGWMGDVIYFGTLDKTFTQSQSNNRLTMFITTSNKFLRD